MIVILGQPRHGNCSFLLHRQYTCNSTFLLMIAAKLFDLYEGSNLHSLHELFTVAYLGLSGRVLKNLH